MYRHLYSTVAVAIFISLSALSGPLYSDITGASAPLEVTEADRGKTFALSIGQVMHVTLAVQLGTGFSWQLNSSTTSLLAFDSMSIERESSAPGSTELQRCIFHARGAGTGMLKLDYSQPWMRYAPPAKTFEITVNITP